MRRCSAASSRIRPTAPAIASTSPTGKRKPLSPSRMTSGSPPARDATTGTPQASASSAARPKASVWLGKRNAWARRSVATTSSCSPRKSTSAARPRARTSASMRGALGPVARAATGGTGASRRTRSNTAMHVVDALERAEVRAVHDRRRRRRGRARRRARREAVGVDEVRDHLDVARDAEVLARARCASDADGAVTPSDCSIEKRVIGRYDGSLPTSVMSVPCSVVTTRGARAPRICCAR